MTKRIPLNKNKKSNGTDNVLPIEQSAQIIEEDISMQMRSSYLNYAMSVITDRALPDVRDGLKPVHRRILYAMHGMGLSSTAKTRKSAAVTGEVLGKYHPHGNIAVYDAMVKLAQDFGTRYPLVIGQGNFGSIDGDSPAAERYTEAKLSKLAESMLQDIHKKTVLFQPNYENIHEEPTVLPAVVPHLLVNGAFGIAVAMATSIPPHNLTEVCNGALHLLENPDASVSDLMKHIKAPDFPLGGLVYDVKAIKSAYTTGRGSVVMRGEVTIEDEKKNTHIIITSIPYNVNKATLIQSIGELVQEKKIDGIKDLRDESTKDIRIVIEVKSSHEPQRILHLLYKHTSLESKFNFNMVGLIEGTPRTLTLPLILTTYLNHRRGVVEKRIAFDLAEAKAREHIVSGLKKALDHIDAIITLIRGSKDVDTARAELIKKYKFSDLQTQAILDMKLQRLAGLERKKIEEELKTLHESISKFEDILKNKKKIDAEVGNEIVLLRDAFGDARRTTIVHTAPGAVSEEELVADETHILLLSDAGYIKRTSVNEYRSQKRGGVGTKAAELREEDFTTRAIITSTRNTVYFFSNTGKVYKTKMYELPLGNRSTKGKALINYIALTAGERITSMIAVDAKQEKTGALFFITKQGTIKKTNVNEFDNIRKSGIVAVQLDTHDELVSTFLVQEKDTVCMVSSDGKSIRFEASSLRSLGRSARGVRGMNLQKGDAVIGGLAVTDNKGYLAVVSEKGLGKKTSLSEFKVQSRGGTGIIAMDVSDRTGKVNGVFFISDVEKEDTSSELLVMSKKGNIVRFSAKDIPERGRSTQGVSLIKLKDGDSVSSSSLI